MKNPDRNLLVLLKQDFMNQRDVDKEIENLNDILRDAESSLRFFIAHELVDRNYITSSVEKILKARHSHELKPFRFLINKN